MKKKTILITGASSGFGRQTALELLQTGEWTVYAASRHPEKMIEIESAGARILTMDVSSDEDVKKGVQKILRKEKRIDCLFANAGYGSYGTIESIPMDEIRYQYEVNVFGVARALKAVLPSMRKQNSGRIVITSSLVSHLSTAGIGWYASTKHALLGIGTALRQEVQGSGIRVVMIEPGMVSTGFEAVAFKKLKKVKHPAEYKNLLTGLESFIRDGYAKAPDPASTVACILKAITKKRPKPVYRTTPDARILPKLISLLPPRMMDRMILTKMRKAAKKQ